MSGEGCSEEVVAAAAEEEEIIKGGMGWYGGKVRMVKGEAADEMMLLWGIQQPTFSKPNAFVYQSSLNFPLDACGRFLSIFQSPSSLSTPGVTGAVMWDSGVVLGKFLEHAVESGTINLQGKKVIELGSGCGLVGCIAALLGAQVILTDLQDRLRLLKKNVEANLYGDVRGSATVSELTWGDYPDSEMIEPLPDYVLGSDVIYSEGAVIDLLDTLLELSGSQTTVILAGELRNDAVLEYFLEAAMQEFIIARVDQAGWHPEHRSPRVVMTRLMGTDPSWTCWSLSVTRELLVIGNTKGCFHVSSFDGSDDLGKIVTVDEAVTGDIKGVNLLHPHFLHPSSSASTLQKTDAKLKRIISANEREIDEMRRKLTESCRRLWLRRKRSKLRRSW